MNKMNNINNKNKETPVVSEKFKNEVRFMIWQEEEEQKERMRKTMVLSEINRIINNVKKGV